MILDKIGEIVGNWWRIEDNPPKVEVDVVVGFGAGQKPDGSLSKLSKSTVKKCCELYEEGTSLKIIFNHGDAINGISVSEEMRRYAVKLGVPRNEIFIEKKSKMQTWEDVIHSSEIIEEEGFKDVLLVSHDLHLTRAVRCFQVYNRRKNLELNLYWLKSEASYDPKSTQMRLHSQWQFLAWGIPAAIYYKLLRRM